MLSLAKKFVYDIIPKTSIFSNDVEVNVSALQQLCLQVEQKIVYELKTKVKLIIIGELLKWGCSEAWVQHQIKSFSKINTSHFQKLIKTQTNTCTIIPKKNSNK